MASGKSWDAVIVGPVANYDVTVAEFLSKYGLKCIIVRPPDNPVPPADSFPAAPRYFPLDAACVSQGPRWFYRLCRSANVVISLTGTLTFFLKEWSFPALVRFPPLVTFMTGADMTELSIAKGRAGILYRQQLRRAALNILAPYPVAMRNSERLGLKNVAAVRYPYLLAPRAKPEAPAAGPITYLLAGRLDWGAHDNAPSRLRAKNTKGSDRFLRAFIAAVRAGADIRCTILDRGPDREAARELIGQSGVGERFEWRPSVSSSGLRQMFAAADIVVDQFDVGAFGGVALEAMAQGKPVMIHLDPTYISHSYPAPPPIINCHTEEEILAAILSHTDRSILTAKGDEAETWVRMYHAIDADFSDLIRQIGQACGQDWPPLSAAPS